MRQLRIVSLLPAATEIVCALGCERLLVGRSHECDYPQSILDLPVLTSSKLPSSLRSSGLQPEASAERQIPIQLTTQETNKQIESILSYSLSIYKVNSELLRKLKPDIIITQSQCELCAITPRDLERITDRWIQGKPKLLSLKPETLTDVWNDIIRISKILGKDKEGRKLVFELKLRIEKIQRKSRILYQKPRVLVLEWLNPLMSGGNWTPQLVKATGGKSLLATSGKHSPQITFSDIEHANPDIIVITPCGFDLRKTEVETKRLFANNNEFQKLKN